MIPHHAVLYCVPEPEHFSIGDFYELDDVVEYRFPTLGIGEVRSLIEAAHRRPSGNAANQTLVVITNFITEEAQQALLKIVEEPPNSTGFVFVLPKGVTLLPTLVSRLQVETTDSRPGEDECFKEFLKAPLNRRLRLIEDSVKAKDQDWQMAIKIGLIGYLGKREQSLSAEQLIGLEYAARLLLTRGASNKFLLEHIALVLPT